MRASQVLVAHNYFSISPFHIKYFYNNFKGILHGHKSSLASQYITSKIETQILNSKSKIACAYLEGCDDNQ